MIARKPESELGIRDHEPRMHAGPVRVGRVAFREGHRVSAIDRFRQTVIGDITRFERMDTKATATGKILYLKTPVVYAVVEYKDHQSIVLDVRKLTLVPRDTPRRRS